MNILTIDLGGFSYRLFFRFRKKGVSDILDAMKHTFVWDMRNLKRKFLASKIIVAGECKREDNWRVDILPSYKANRHVEITEENEEEQLLLKETITQFHAWAHDLSEYSIDTIQYDRCEGDDIIATIAMNRDPNIVCYIVSDDKDFQQLLRYKNTYQVSIQSSSIFVLPKYQDVRCHVASGDSTDGIPNIKYGYNINKIYAIINAGKLDEFINTNNLQEAYDLNDKLINMANIPKDYQVGIMDKFNKILDKKFHSNK